MPSAGLTASRNSPSPERTVITTFSPLKAQGSAEFVRLSPSRLQHLGEFNNRSRLPAGGEIVIGGGEDGSIPIPEFERLLTKFPTTAELDRYARARVTDVVGQYVDGMAESTTKPTSERYNRAVVTPAKQTFLCPAAENGMSGDGPIAVVW